MSGYDQGAVAVWSSVIHIRSRSHQKLGRIESSHSGRKQQRRAPAFGSRVDAVTSRRGGRPVSILDFEGTLVAVFFTDVRSADNSGSLHVSHHYFCGDA